MLDRTNQMLLATTAVLLVFSGARLWVDSRPPAALWTLDGIPPDALTEIAIERGEERIVLERSDSGFRIREPRTLVADRAKVQQLAREWVEEWGPDLKLVDHPGEDELVTYGLDDAARKRLDVRAGATTWSLEIGKGTSGGSAYLRRVGDTAVYRGRVPGSWQLETGVDAWRDKRLFPFEKDDMAQLDLLGSHGALSFERYENEKEARWRALQPAGWDVSSRGLDVVGRSFSGLKAQRILEGDEAQAARIRAGLDSPRLRAVARTETGVTHTLVIGADADADRTVWAAIDGDDRLFELTIATLRQLDKSKDDLRDKTVLFFPKEQIEEVHFWRGDRHVVVVPEGERDWRVREPAGYDPSPKDIAVAVGSLVNLQAAAIVEDVKPAPQPSDARIEVRLEGGVVHTLQLAQSLGPDRTVATASDKQAVFLLKDMILERLAKGFEAKD